MRLKNAAIDILIGRDSTTINLYDKDAGIQFAEVTLTPQQLSDALSRLGHTDCTITVRALDRVGKKEEVKVLEFPFSRDKIEYKDRKKKAAAAAALKYAEAGWQADTYFGSQNSFYEIKGVQFARTSQRRWVALPEQKETGSP